MKKLIVQFFLIAILGVVALAGRVSAETAREEAGAFAPSAPSPFRIGVILPLSGPIAELGSAVRDGILLAGMNDPGGAAGAEDKLELHFEDDQFDPAKSVAAARKLLSTASPQAFIVVGSGSSLAVAPVIEQAKIPMMSLSISQDVTKGRAYVFRHYLSPDTEGSILAAEAERRKYKKLAIVTTQNEAMLSTREAFLRFNKIPTLITEEILPAERDVRAIATRIRQASPDAVLLCLMTPQGGIVAKALREQGYGGAFFSAHPIEIDPELQKPERVLAGSWFVSNDLAAEKPFVQRYEAAFGKHPKVGASNGFDIANLLIAALRSPAPEAYLAHLKGYSGALGTYDATPDHAFTIPGAVHEVPR